MGVNGKKFFLIGFVFVLLVGIPVTIYFLQKQQETRTRANPSTILYFAPASQSTVIPTPSTNPITKNVEDTIPLDIWINPGSNIVSSVKLIILYDPSKIATVSGAFQTYTPFLSILEGPKYSTSSTSGEIKVTVSVGFSPTSAIRIPSKVGTITFKAVADTTGGSTSVRLSGSEAYSIGSTDLYNENVISLTTPATIVIGPALTPTGTVTTTPTPNSTPIPTATLMAVAPTPTATPVATATPTPRPTSTPTPTNGIVVNLVPVCNTLAVDRATTGVEPFAITFTANGTDSDGTISKVNFNFGDGSVSGDVITSGGIGTNSVNVATSHEYRNSGTFTASAVLTDNNGGVSSAAACRQTIFVQSAAVVVAPTNAYTVSTSVVPTIQSPGSVDTAIGIGAVAAFLMIGGGLLFFVL